MCSERSCTQFTHSKMERGRLACRCGPREFPAAPQEQRPTSIMVPSVSFPRGRHRLNYWQAVAGVWSRLLGWLIRRVPKERQRLLAFTILAGGLCGLAAVAFHLSIGILERLLINRANAASGHSWIFWTILTPGLGGLVVGLGLTYWAPAAAGSGIPQVKVAFTLRSGVVSVRETIGKFVLCSLQIGSGASLGLEGPTVQICAGVSSMLARAARLSPEFSRRMTSVGMAAAIAAAFNAPIAAITFTARRTDRRPGPDHALRAIVAAALARRGGALHSGHQPRVPCHPALRVCERILPDLVRAAGHPGGRGLHSVYGFAAGAACALQSMENISAVGASGAWRTGHRRAGGSRP